mmetsp:Transcript_19781/g.27151  ORF Transcript_19781/g.27151 Transcript_19781/m.27151 type:complete len:145 (-) Transcript_19781:317-751(-)|eukprot:CAMPEP_0185723864 /NCGR_PEP_ID=MMETSP1171-20130828/555_1 /TAXON_ID=374046 /ORGANISM="Helicotheca tamensis, Strain CCMP826" /LENGTH=144 /DNA_ID=CAMNT_0028391627 /DNA_START=76 /DNA_END=510 /DNA_ORIENTATION=-
MTKITILFACLLATVATAFVAPSTKQHSFVTLQAKKSNDINSSFDPLNLSAEDKPISKIAAASATAAAIMASSPLMALAEEADDYEYGAVNAPIGIAVGGGLLAIATALLPIVLKGGEEAFEEMKDRDSDSWGTGNTSRLDKRR